MFNSDDTFRDIPLTIQYHDSAPPMLAEPYLPTGAVTLLSAHGGLGKSMLALIIACVCATGRECGPFRFQTAQPVLVLSMEDDPAVVGRRLQRICDEFSFPQELLAQNLRIIDSSHKDAPLAGEAMVHGVRTVDSADAMFDLRRAAVGRKLVIIDNASEAFDGDENSRRQVRRFIRLLARLARENSSAVLLLAHSDKAAVRSGSANNSFSGSTAWHNSARSRMSMHQSRGHVVLTHDKCNDALTHRDVAFRWSERGVLVPADATPVEAGESILSALRAAAQLGIDVPETRTGAANAYSTLKSFEQLSPVLREDRSQFWLCLTGLMSAGKVVSCLRTTADRKQRKVLACA